MLMSNKFQNTYMEEGMITERKKGGILVKTLINSVEEPSPYSVYLFNIWSICC